MGCQSPRKVITKLQNTCRVWSIIPNCQCIHEKQHGIASSYRSKSEEDQRILQTAARLSLHCNIVMLGSLAGVKGNVRCRLHKLKGIKADLVCGNEEWRECDFKNLLDQLKKWTEINSVEEINTETLHEFKFRNFTLKTNNAYTSFQHTI